MVASFAAATLGVVACGNSGTGGSGGSGGSGTTTSHATTSSVVTTTSTTGSTTSTTSTGSGACTEITVSGFKVVSGDGSSAGYSGDVAPDQGDSTDTDQLDLEFYGSGFDAMYNGETTGTFDLSMGNDTNYATCSRCVLVYQDPNADAPKIFFATSGTMTLDAASKHISGTINGTLTDVKLVEVTIDDSFNSTPVAGGACLHLASLSMMAGPPAGWTCSPGYYGDGDCDCGCGVKDIDCTDTMASSCKYCDDMGSCSTDACPGTINPTDNTSCVAAADGGTDGGP